MEFRLKKDFTICVIGCALDGCEARCQFSANPDDLDADAWKLLENVGGSTSSQAAEDDNFFCCGTRRLRTSSHALVEEFSIHWIEIDVYKTRRRIQLEQNRNIPTYLSLLVL